MLKNGKVADRPDDWPCNGYEYRIERLCDAIDAFKAAPSYRTKEIVVSIACAHDLHEHTGCGRYRLTAYQTAMLNELYMFSFVHNFPSVRGFVYETISDTTRGMKLVSPMLRIHPEGEKNAYPDGNPFVGLLPPLLLFHAGYQEYVYDYSKSLSVHLIGTTRLLLNGDKSEEYRLRIQHGYTSMLNDLSYMRGVKRDSVLCFSREELSYLVAFESELMMTVGVNPAERPLRGVMMTQLSNWILKSRNGYNDECVVKYFSPDTARLVAGNDELWMHSVQKLNDGREGCVVPELLKDLDWLEYEWAHDIVLKPSRRYYVASFSKNRNSEVLKKRYGACRYGFKGDRVVDLLSPIGHYNGVVHNAQTIVLDVIYDRDVAKDELRYLCSLIELLPMSSVEKHGFFEEILQYWLLSVKDKVNEDGQWDVEQERRAVLFLYDGEEYSETRRDEDYFRMKTGMFMFPDYILGDNPCRDYLFSRAREKRRGTSSEDCLFCHDCLSRDYDTAQYGKPGKLVCSICGSNNVEFWSVRSRLSPNGIQGGSQNWRLFPCGNSA